ncbi:MAG TPA: hypothetical protein VF116_11535 [Ktedonobacterales bacterium]
MANDRGQKAERGQQEQALEQADARPGERAGQNPFLRKMRQVERQGVPEEGAVNPGPPPRPVRSGEFHTGPIPPEGHGEE